MLVGIVTSTYSTIFIASAIAILLSPAGARDGQPPAAPRRKRVAASSRRVRPRARVARESRSPRRCSASSRDSPSSCRSRRPAHLLIAERAARRSSDPAERLHDRHPVRLDSGGRCGSTARSSLVACVRGLCRRDPDARRFALMHRAGVRARGRRRRCCSRTTSKRAARSSLPVIAAAFIVGGVVMLARRAVPARAGRRSADRTPLGRARRDRRAARRWRSSRACRGPARRSSAAWCSGCDRAAAARVLVLPGHAGDGGARSRTRCWDVRHDLPADRRRRDCGRLRDWRSWPRCARRASRFSGSWRRIGLRAVRLVPHRGWRLRDACRDCRRLALVSRGRSGAAVAAPQLHHRLLRHRAARRQRRRDRLGVPVGRPADRRARRAAVRHARAGPRARGDGARRSWRSARSRPT